MSTGETGEVRRATLEEVKERFEYLKRKRDEERAKDNTDIATRIQMAQEQAEREREEKRRKRNEKRRKTKDGMGVPDIKLENDGLIC